MLRILVVEDDKYEAANFKALLVARGDECELHDDGKDLNQQIKRFRPDVVILDVVLPGEDGYQICRKLKADADIRSTPVVFASSVRRANNDADWGRRSGGVAYLSKPLTAEDLDFALEIAVGTRLVT